MSFNRIVFVATEYKGKPAILDTVARVYYVAKTMEIAQARANELNKGV
jgi:hypothetical protein